jgi:hypothetical protein
MQVCAEQLKIALLLADDFRRDILDDARTMRSRLSLRSHEIFQCMADPPDAGSPFSAGPEQLFHLRCQHR